MTARLLDLHRRSDASSPATIGQTLIRLARLAESAHRFRQVHGSMVAEAAHESDFDMAGAVDAVGDPDGLDRCVSLDERDDLLGRSPAERAIDSHSSNSIVQRRANGLGPKVVVADATRTDAGRRFGSVRTEVNR